MKWIDEEMIPDVCEGVAKIVMKYVQQHPNAPYKVIADIIQAGIEGWVEGTTMRLNQAEMDMEDD